MGGNGEGKTRVSGEKTLGAEKRTNNKFNPHMTSSPGTRATLVEGENSCTTAPSLLPLIHL